LVSPGSTGATVSFADLTKAQGETNLESLNMPEPCHFLDPTLGPVAIIRKTSAKLSAVAAIRGFVDDGLFIGRKDPAFLNMVFQLAEEADAARREL